MPLGLGYAAGPRFIPLDPGQGRRLRAATL